MLSAPSPVFGDDMPSDAYTSGMDRQGYCGADLRALCTEAALHAVRRHYPQIYASDRRLLLDPSLIQLAPADFAAAFAALVPASRRTVPLAVGRPLPLVVAPLFDATVQVIHEHVRTLLALDAPGGAAAAGPGAPGLSEAAESALAMLLEADDDGSSSNDATAAAQQPVARQLIFSDEDDGSSSGVAAAASKRGLGLGLGQEPQPRRSFLRAVYRPRLVLYSQTLGWHATETVARAVLHACNGINIQSLEPVSLLSDPSRTPEVRKKEKFRPGVGPAKEKEKRRPGVEPPHCAIRPTSLRDPAHLTARSGPPLCPIWLNENSATRRFRAFALSRSSY